jgi:hypothetical protein
VQVGQACTESARADDKGDHWQLPPLAFASCAAAGSDWVQSDGPGAAHLFEDGGHAWNREPSRTGRAREGHELERPPRPVPSVRCLCLRSDVRRGVQAEGRKFKFRRSLQDSMLTRASTPRPALFRGVCYRVAVGCTWSDSLTPRGLEHVDFPQQKPTTGLLERRGPGAKPGPSLSSCSCPIVPAINSPASRSPGPDCG